MSSPWVDGNFYTPGLRLGLPSFARYAGWRAGIGDRGPDSAHNRAENGHLIPLRCGEGRVSARKRRAQDDIARRRLDADGDGVGCGVGYGAGCARGDPFEECGGGHGFAEEPSLGVADSAGDEELRLRFGLDTFSDGLEVERAGHLNNVNDDLAGCAVGVDGFDEGLIDFERVERKRLQAGERGVAGAEVVDGDAEAAAAQVADERGGFRITEEGALGSFNADVVGQSAGGVEQLLELLEECGRSADRRPTY